jgi:hypothetical protein
MSSNYSSGGEPPVPAVPSFPPSLAKRNRTYSGKGPAEIWFHVARILLGLVVLAALVTVWIGMAPSTSGSSSADWDKDAASALITNEANNQRTEGAPQQQVVNGWYANDLSAIMLRQESYIAASNDRNGAVLATLVAGLAGWAIIGGIERVSRYKKHAVATTSTGATATANAVS